MLSHNRIPCLWLSRRTDLTRQKSLGILNWVMHGGAGSFLTVPPPAARSLQQARNYPYSLCVDLWTVMIIGTRVRGNVTAVLRCGRDNLRMVVMRVYRGVPGMEGSSKVGRLTM